MNLSGPKEGLWKDFASGEGGNIFQLIQREKGLSFKDSVTYLADILKVKVEPMAKSIAPSLQQTTSLKDAKDMASRLNAVSELQMKSKPIGGTIAETYLNKERGITEELASDLRYLPKNTSFMYQGERKILTHSCLAAFGRDHKGRLSSVQLTKLTEEGERALTHDGQKLTKIQYGIAKGSFVCLQEDKTHDRVFIAEGIETALSLKEAGLKGRIMASLGIHNISNYQGSEKEVILCADNDAHKQDSQTHKIMENTKDQFITQGKSASIIRPSQPGDDFNDVLKKQGVQSVQSYVKPYLDPNKEKLTQPSISSQNRAQATKTTYYPVEKTNSIDVIADYIQSKLRDIKAYEGTHLADRAKEELKDYMQTLQKNETLFQTIKDQNKDLFKEFQKEFQKQFQKESQEQAVSRSRGFDLGM
ncbi:MAG TPA: toprim domain-containing protein [Alphaproteobacteria bacterium]|nr:toprim domain-containing protein [Alphaproteobacteria bacterium]